MSPLFIKDTLGPSFPYIVLLFSTPFTSLKITLMT